MSHRPPALFGVFLVLVSAAALIACSDEGSAGAGGGSGSGGAGAASGGASGTSMTGGSSGGGAAGAAGTAGAAGSGGAAGSPAGDSGSFDVSGDNNTNPEDGSDETPNECSGRTDVDTYVANLRKAGKSGVLTFQLVESVPAPPIRGNNTWTFRVTQSDSTPVTQGVTARVDMPDHNHNITIQPELTFDAATGTYNVSPLYFFMPGRWRTVFTVNDGTSGSPPIDTAEFIFCVF